MFFIKHRVVQEITATATKIRKGTGSPATLPWPQNARDAGRSPILCPPVICLAIPKTIGAIAKVVISAGVSTREISSPLLTPMPTPSRSVISVAKPTGKKICEKMGSAPIAEPISAALKTPARMAVPPIELPIDTSIPPPSTTNSCPMVAIPVVPLLRRVFSTLGSCNVFPLVRPANTKITAIRMVILRLSSCLKRRLISLRPETRSRCSLMSATFTPSFDADYR